MNVKRAFIFLIILQSALQSNAQTITASKATNAQTATQNEALKKTAYSEGYKSGKDFKETGGSRPETPDHVQKFAVFSLRHNFPKLEKFSELKEAYILGFVTGYKGAIPFSDLYIATPQPLANQTPQQSSDIKQLKLDKENAVTVKGASSISLNEALNQATKQVPRNAVVIETKQYIQGNINREYIVDIKYAYYK